MIDFYFNGSPNPMKVALFLEEAGLAYTPKAIDVRLGDQHAPGFHALNPNGKVPVIVDDGITVFDSNAILLYLAEKTGRFLPLAGPQTRAELLSWLMFAASGLGPFMGQAVHFRHFAPEPVPYAHTRYQYEARRHLGVLDQRLADRRYMLGDTYTIVDMAVWGWSRMAAFPLGEDPANAFPHLARLTAEIEARPAAVRAVALKDGFTFKTEADDESRRIMFPHQVLAPAV